MLPRSDNERICRVGPGTPMGEVFRRYWLPVCVSTQIAKPDSAPLRVSLLGERLVVFRDSAGKVGVLDELCPHRGASLALGRVEECGEHALDRAYAPPFPRLPAPRLPPLSAIVKRTV